jgi:hypothetical protein
MIDGKEMAPLFPQWQFCERLYVCYGSTPCMTAGLIVPAKQFIKQETVVCTAL